MVTLEFPFTYNDYINPHFWPLKPHLHIWALEIERRKVRLKVWASVWEVWGLKPNSRILLSNKDFSFQKIVKVSKTCKSLLKWLFDKLSCVKPVLTNFSQFFIRLIFHLDCEEHIFDRISRNTYPNWMGLVSLWSRSENISYELKLIFSSFWRNFVDRAWIWGCRTHVHQIRQFKQQWNTSGCDTKFISYPFSHSSFQKVFTSCNFQAIFFWLFTFPDHWHMADLWQMIKWLLLIQLQSHQMF